MKFRGFGIRGRAGTTAIEFAFLSPALLLMALGIYEFGRWCWAHEAIQESAAQGARCVAIAESACESSGSYSSSATATYVQGVASGWGLNVPTANVISSNSTSCGGVSGFSQVQVSYTFTTVVSRLIPAGTNGTTMTVTSCFPNNAS